MDTQFWHQKWHSNDIGFHEGEANALLVTNFHQLKLPTGSRVFVPLCGKTRDIAWLLHQGYRVVGAELSEVAVMQLFAELRDELGIEPTISTMGSLTHHQAHGSKLPALDVFVGDIFALTPEQLGSVDAIYDRAALVALPAEMRTRYTQHLLQLTNQAPQLLICFDYQQSVMPGPPFAISPFELQRHYGDSHQIELLTSVMVPGGLKGKCPAQENLWMLTAQSS